jgi:PAS domain S-box-containing protein
MDARSAPDVSLAPESQLNTILEGIGEGFYAVDNDWRILLFNAQAAHHFGIEPAAALGHRIWDLFPGSRDTDLGRLFEQVMATREPVKSETASVIFPGRWLAYRLFPLDDGIGVVFRDISDRKTAEEHRDLLLNELNHRVKNTLAIVQALAAQTFRHSGVDRSAQRTFEARLLNLSEVHNVLTDQNWDSAELHDVVRAALGPHCAPGREPFTVEGPGLRLRPKSAVALSMTLHELCTNATKYGALSVDAGHVVVKWRVAGGRFLLRWHEHGGPPVSPPTHQGFGSRLIQRSLAAEFLGHVQITFDPTGVVCTIDAPYGSVRDEHSAA